MSAGRRSARRQAAFLLYQQDLLERDWRDTSGRAVNLETDAYSRSLVSGVTKELVTIDGILSQHLSGWSLERLGTLERAILRLATYELLYEPDVPEAVAINEAVELAKRFCSDEAAGLVNGVLGSLAAGHKERIGEIRGSADTDLGTAI